ncbi:MAG TPA: rhomboid family intramembrane serine protease [Anaerolineales bacterium]|nr:rhomboid family intramembrane serine protease [Anaerolineales bacterium]
MIVGDQNPLRRLTPIITYGLIAVNVIVFFLELQGGEPFIIQWSFIPSEFLANPSREFVTIFTSMFMHAGELHLFGNMLYLWIFGDNVEDRFGHQKFLIFYLACGVAATFTQLAFSQASTIPNLGASGAIAGVLGAYLVMFPQGRVLMAAGRGVFPVSALVAIGLWFLLQLFSGIGSLGASADAGGVAYMAHIGGFVAGFVLTYLLVGRSQARV